MSEANTIVTVAQDGPVATITMDDGKANALSPDLMEQLNKALDETEREAKAIVLAGREGKFCAGFDLRIMMQGPDAARALVSTGGDLLLRLYEIPLPLVIACTGHAIAGGVLLAATGDTRIGARGAFKLGLNEVAAGMPVPVLAHEFARDRLATTELFAAVVQSKIYDPDAAAVAGWLDMVVEPGEVLAEATKVATRLAGMNRQAYAVSKRSLRRQTIRYIRDNMQSNLEELLLRPS